MRKAILVGVSVMMMGWSSSALAQQAYVRITDAHIVQIRDALRLTPAQAQHWPAVEVALRDLAQREHSIRRGGLVNKINGAAEVRRLIAIANPLIKMLTEAQKREAVRIARGMGVPDSVAAAF